MLSIIIPTLNEEKYLPRLLSSIKSQDFFDYEIIVSDAGSVDSTKVLAERSGARVILSDKIKHPSFQRNQGVLHAHGDYILFLDADSELPERFLIKSIEEFKTRKLNVASFYFKFNPNRWHYNIYSFISNTIFYLKQNTSSPAAIGAGIMVEKKKHLEVKGFDLKVLLAEDYDYCARLAKVGKFGILKSTKLLYSSRRIEKEGFWVTGWKWLKMGFFTLTNRKIKKQIVNYDFGKF